ncbi:MAG: hypothetical protein IJZ55_04025 [Lachnospiraceae bacterium]|nr:hypothetical protein [Lachnospiraceae bacterium]
MRRKRGNGLWEALKLLLAPVLVIAVLYCVLTAIGGVEQGQQQENEKRLQDAIKKAVVTCYTIEGVYPATLEYVEEHYGLVVDRDRYDVFYEIFADNIMPDITVIPKRK